jgi:ferredoxin
MNGMDPAARNMSIRRDGTACDLCGICVAVCPAGAIVIDRFICRYSRNLCTFCLNCLHACPIGALALEKDVDEKKV